MQRYRVLVCYDGSDFLGWQSQNKQGSIQDCIQECLSVIFREKIHICGASRTDKGVHAIGQVAHFDTCQKINKFQFIQSTSSILPESIRIISIEEASSDFHSRFDALSKWYSYYIHTFDCHTPWSHKTSAKFHCLDINLMEEAALYLEGTKDFGALTNSKGKNCTAYKDCIRTIYQVKISSYGLGIKIDVHGNGFLYKMVRNIAGALIAVGKGTIKVAEFKKIIDCKIRNEVIVTAPAKGLFLKRVIYKEATFEKFTNLKVAKNSL